MKSVNVFIYAFIYCQVKAHVSDYEDESHQSQAALPQQSGGWSLH